jgi:hypothetical protein
VYPFQRCGLEKKIISEDCCISTSPEWEYYPLYTGGTLSGVISQVDSFQDFKSVVPTIPTKSKYCKIENYKGHGSSFNEFMYILNDNQCVEDHYKCTNDGVIWVFPGQDCKGISTIKFKLDDKPQQVKYPLANYKLETTFIHHVMVSFVELKGGEGKIEWTGVYPKNNHIQKNEYKMEILSSGLNILALGVGIFTAGYWFKSYLTVRTSHNIHMSQSQFLLLVFIIARGVYTYIPIDVNIGYVVSFVTDWAFGLSTLLNALATCHFLFMVFRLAKAKEMVMVVMVVLLNFGSMGGHYQKVIADITKDQYPKYYLLVEEWLNIDFYWILFVFLFSLLPLLIFVSKIHTLKSNSIDGVFKNVKAVDPWVFPLYIFQIAITLVYFVCGYLQLFTLILSNDFNQMALEGVKVFAICLNSSVNCFLIDRVQTIAENERGVELESPTGSQENISDK